MMFVDKKKILISSVGVSGGTIDIPLGTDFFPIDNAELIQDKFVNDEKEKSINDIIDNKKIIFRPADKNWDIVPKFKLKVNFYTPTSIVNNDPQYRGYLTGANVPGMYSDISFIFDDLFCRTNRFLFSFLRLIFYDNPNSGQNKVLFFNDIYTQIGKDQKNPAGIVLPVDECPISFAIGDPVLLPDMIHESYHLYWFKDLVDNAINQEYEMWMSAVFNNAANGSSKLISTSKIPDPANVQISGLNTRSGILYLKVILKNDNGVYKYRFEPNDKQKPDGTPANQGGVNFNPTYGDPQIIFWQIIP